MVILVVGAILLLVYCFVCPLGRHFHLCGFEVKAPLSALLLAVQKAKGLKLLALAAVAPAGLSLV
jgi:hypothetical protein